MSILDDFEDLCKEQDDSTELFLISIIEDSDNPRIIRDYNNHTLFNNYYTQNIHDKSEIFIFIDTGASYENNIIIGSINRGFKSINYIEFEFYNNLFLKKYIKNPVRDSHKLPSYRILSMNYKQYDVTIY
jgi:hypothetical protein